LAQEAPKGLLSIPLSFTHSGSYLAFPLPLYKSLLGLDWGDFKVFLEDLLELSSILLTLERLDVLKHLFCEIT